MSNLDALHARAKALNLHGLLAHWSEAAPAGWVEALIDWEEQERGRRSLERRLGSAHIGRKPGRLIRFHLDASSTTSPKAASKRSLASSRIVGTKCR